MPECGHDGDLPVLIWRLGEPRVAIASAPLGGGIGTRDWICNAQVSKHYARTDLDAHLLEVARAQSCSGDGVGMLTAAAVERVQHAADGGVEAFATIGLTSPTWAADEDGALRAWSPGTINIVAFLPVRLSDAALVNAVMTVTEAKTQALIAADVPGTGTASDAVCIVCPVAGKSELFGGPRSEVGAPLARAVYAAVLRGAR